jgi:hypothetical protein
VRAGDVLLDVLPVSHNLPLACPGMQEFVFSGATVASAAARYDLGPLRVIQRAAADADSLSVDGAGGFAYPMAAGASGQHTSVRHWPRSGVSRYRSRTGPVPSRPCSAA